MSLTQCAYVYFEVPFEDNSEDGYSHKLHVLESDAEAVHAHARSLGFKAEIRRGSYGFQDLEGAKDYITSQLKPENRKKST